MRLPRAAPLRQLPKLGSARPALALVLGRCRRGASSSASARDAPPAVDVDALRAEMLARPPQLSWDVLSPTHSALLDVALADFLPASCRTAGYAAGAGIAGAAAAAAAEPRALPPAHHLVYFPLQKTAAELLADGTDPFHSPGAPFARRMWAGGSVEFLDVAGPRGREPGFRLDSRAAVCRERIVGVAAKGPPGREKVFVDVLREYMCAPDFERAPGDAPAPRGIREHRGLVFLRGVTADEARDDLARAATKRSRIVKAPNPPDFSVTLTPTPTLLFHYSALTFNAHAIHLDPEYCRTVEGRRGLLVHGPLSLTLSLAVLGSRLAPGERVRAIEYRNLAPLYVGEPLRVCVRLVGDGNDGDGGDGGRPRRWEVWVEDEDGGLSVRGTATSLRPTD
ncbi:HotDog domain-containing protein [Durotheca rogersii]|uniref:HotDog domain-containing protein n=1 Tax=Durotheca rogersii TaxID=419775 RepID=UPI00221F0593|nr:HotDog domain-containing protein [Durotheca rogersii]KAI5863093.1 HotDog domain-containing protein [Durotheca rogersii]